MKREGKCGGGGGGGGGEERERDVGEVCVQKKAGN